MRKNVFLFLFFLTHILAAQQEIRVDSLFMHAIHDPVFIKYAPDTCRRFYLLAQKEIDSTEKLTFKGKPIIIYYSMIALLKDHDPITPYFLYRISSEHRKIVMSISLLYAETPNCIRLVNYDSVWKYKRGRLKRKKYHIVKTFEGIE